MPPVVPVGVEVFNQLHSAHAFKGNDQLSIVGGEKRASAGARFACVGQGFAGRGDHRGQVIKRAVWAPT